MTMEQKGLPGTNTLAYRIHLSVTKKRNCCEYGPSYLQHKHLLSHLPICQNFTKILYIIFANQGTLKAGAQHEYLFIKLATIHNKGRFVEQKLMLARAKGVTKFITVCALNLVTLCYAAQVQLQHTTYWPQLSLRLCFAEVGLFNI